MGDDGVETGGEVPERMLGTPRVDSSDREVGQEVQHNDCCHRPDTESHVSRSQMYHEGISLGSNGAHNYRPNSVRARAQEVLLVAADALTVLESGGTLSACPRRRRFG
jgi:hypothetical protein